MEFTATFDGWPSRNYPTLQSAMAWAEELDNPTGAITFQGDDIIRYRNGNITPA